MFSLGVQRVLHVAIVRLFLTHIHLFEIQNRSLKVKFFLSFARIWPHSKDKSSGVFANTLLKERPETFEPELVDGVSTCTSACMLFFAFHSSLSGFGNTASKTMSVQSQIHRW